MIRTLALVAAALAAITVLGCGSSGDADSGSTADGAFAAMKERFATTAYVPAYQRCIIEEAERIVPEERVAALAELSENEQFQASSALMEPAILACAEKIDEPIDPDASPEEIRPIKLLSAEQLAVAVKEEGAPDSAVICVKRRLSNLPDDEFVEYANDATSPQGEKELIRVLRPCIDALRSLGG